MKEQNLSKVIEAEIGEMVTTRFNVVTGLTEYSINNGKTYSTMTDRMVNTILRKLRSNEHKVGVNTVRNILGSDFSEPYNPFNEYFDSLHKWDGETDHISALCATVDVENDAHFVKWVTKWLVAMVACMLNPEVVNHQVLVLTGGQGIGKTTWFEKLVPNALKNYYNTGYVNPDSKDALIQASECFLVNMDELSSLNAKNIEALKQLITQKTIRTRKPYGYNHENLVKRASFGGSTNDEQFLRDVTGNRRFLCFKATDIDLNALDKIHIDQVFAQAHDLYADGFQYWFDKSENALIEANNEDFVVKTVEDEAILTALEPCGPSEVSPLIMKLTATGVTEFLASKNLISSGSQSAQKVGRSLVKLGFHRGKSNGRMLYTVKLRA